MKDYIYIFEIFSYNPLLYIEKRKPKQHMIFLQYLKHHIILLQNIIIVIFDKLSQHTLYV